MLYAYTSPMSRPRRHEELQRQSSIELPRGNRWNDSAGFCRHPRFNHFVTGGQEVTSAKSVVSFSLHLTRYTFIMAEDSSSQDITM